MKKYFCLILVMLFSLSIFLTGCEKKGENSTLADLRNQYYDVVEDEDYEILFNDDKIIEIEYITKLETLINYASDNDQATTEQKKVYANYQLLEVGGVYDTLLKASSRYFQYFITRNLVTLMTNNDPTPKKQKYSLYKKINALDEALENVVDKKEDLEKIFIMSGEDPTRISSGTIAQTALKRYFRALNNLINKFLKVSAQTESMVRNYLYDEFNYKNVYYDKLKEDGTTYTTINFYNVISIVESSRLNFTKCVYNCIIKDNDSLGEVLYPDDDTLEAEFYEQIINLKELNESIATLKDAILNSTVFTDSPDLPEDRQYFNNYLSLRQMENNWNCLENSLKNVSIESFKDGEKIEYLTVSNYLNYSEDYFAYITNFMASTQDLL